MSTTNCLNCGRPLHELDFCGQCGQRNVRPQLSLPQILGDAWSVVTDLDNRWIRTFRKLFTMPGQMVTEYIEGKRTRYAGPVQYFLVMCGISFAFNPRGINRSLLPEPETLETSAFESLIVNTISMIEEYVVLYVLLLSPLSAILTWFIYVNRGRNFTEVLVLILYLLAQLAFVGVIVNEISVATGQYPMLDQLSFILILAGIPAYITWAFIEFFGGGLVRGFLSGLVVAASFIFIPFGIYVAFLSLLFSRLANIS